MSNFLESAALAELTTQNDKVKIEERKEEIKNPDPKCPRCGRSIKGKLIHLVTPDQIMHTFLCGNEKCQTVISLQIDFMTMHSQMMQAMGVGAEQNQGRTPGGLYVPGN
jgi:hypothetical protein